MKVSLVSDTDVVGQVEAQDAATLWNGAILEGVATQVRQIDGFTDILTAGLTNGGTTRNRFDDCALGLHDVDHAYLQC